jgi:hypothetical protein
MDRANIRPTALGAMGIAQEGNIVGRGRAIMDVLESYLHRTNSNAKLLESGKEVEKVVRREG